MILCIHTYMCTYVFIHIYIYIEHTDCIHIAWLHVVSFWSGKYTNTSKQFWSSNPRLHALMALVFWLLEDAAACSFFADMHASLALKSARLCFMTLARDNKFVKFFFELRCCTNAKPPFTICMPEGPPRVYCKQNVTMHPAAPSFWILSLLPIFVSKGVSRVR